MLAEDLEYATDFDKEGQGMVTTRASVVDVVERYIYGLGKGDFGWFLEMARYYGFGLTSKEVALKTGVTPGTARAHLEEIYSRLDVHSRVALAALLIREGIV